MRQSWSRSVKFWQRYENQQILLIQCISPSKPVRFASFLFHWMRKRNIRTLLYYNFLWMSAILMWKMESLELLPSQSPGGGKMSEAVTSSNIFKWTQLTGGHSMGIQTDPGDLYFWASLGWLHNSVCWLHSLKDSIHSLKNWINSRSGWGTLLHWKNVGPRTFNWKQVTPRLPEDCMEWKNVGPRTDPANSCGHSNRPGTFIFVLHWVGSAWLIHSVYGCAWLSL